MLSAVNAHTSAPGSQSREPTLGHPVSKRYKRVRSEQAPSSHRVASSTCSRGWPSSGRSRLLGPWHSIFAHKSHIKEPRAQTAKCGGQRARGHLALAEKNHDIITTHGHTHRQHGHANMQKPTTPASFSSWSFRRYPLTTHPRASSPNPQPESPALRSAPRAGRSRRRARRSGRPHTRRSPPQSAARACRHWARWRRSGGRRRAWRWLPAHCLAARR